MTLIERYILKIAFNAFAACLVALTGVIWITQALKEIDLLTGKGQTIMVFLTVTGLSLPALVTVISPVALFIAELAFADPALSSGIWASAWSSTVM